VHDKIRIFVSQNKAFRIPDSNDTPRIMVGPGTGVAPFRAFLEERQAIGAKGKNWLFFGDQTRASDYIYEQELEAMKKSGVLSRLDLAFSRDQEEKVYVQHKMHEHGKDLFEWLENGAYFYVCGDATRMAKDVDQALCDISSKWGNLTADQARDYVNSLKRDKRYLRDVY
jgi:sulfite reductase (NADPH) flavoprotein alpha-component